METVRAFIAVDLPPCTMEAIAGVQNHFKSLDLAATWVKPGNIHLTLKFLGDVTPQQIAEIKNRLAETVSGIPGFTVFLKNVGVFPNLNRPRVLWIGLEDCRGTLESLQKKIDGQLKVVGFKPEFKKFSPHLTLARIKSPQGKDRLRREVQASHTVSAKPIEVSSIKLYKSQLTPKGSIYTVLEEFKFKL